MTLGDAVNPFWKQVRWERVGWFYLPSFLTPAKKKIVEEGMTDYVTYREIFSGTEYEPNNPEILREHLLEFDYYDVIEKLAKTNFVLAEHHNGISREELGLVREVFAGESLKRLEKFWSAKRKLITHQTILHLIKKNIMYNAPAEGKKHVQDNKESFGRLLFRPSDIFGDDYVAKRTEGKGEQEKHIILTGNLVANLKFNANPHFYYILARYWTIYTQCLLKAKDRFAGEYFDVPGEFKNATGYEMELFIFFVFSIYFHYKTNSSAELMKDFGKFVIGSGYFNDIQAEYQEQAKLVFDAISMTREGFIEQFEKEKVEKYFEFKPFLRRPLLKENDTYVLLDIHYLEEVITEGLYYQIIDYFLAKREKVSPEDKTSLDKISNDIRQYNAFVGRCYEFYVNDLFRRTYPGHFTKTLYSELDGDDTGGVDFVVYYPDTMFFIELTTSSVRYNTIMSEDYLEFEREVSNIAFSNPGRKQKGKIEQLDNAIKRFREGKLASLGVDPGKIRKIYPVLLFGKGLPIIPPVVSSIVSKAKDKGLLTNDLDNFTVLNLEDLEIIEPMVRKGVTLPSIIEGYLNSKGNKWWEVKNYIILERRSEIAENVFLTAQARELMSAMSKKLFNKDLGIN